MRKIKFRAWSNKYQRMFRVSEISINRNGYTHGTVDAGFKDEFNPSEEEYKSPLAWIGRVDFTELPAWKTARLVQDPNDEPFILMQYTGLRDRNGREIYEGDIVSMFGGTQFSVVEWDDKFGLYRIYLQLSGASDVGEELLGNHLNVVEVIGNIFENPELLKRVNENESSTAF